MKSPGKLSNQLKTLDNPQLLVAFYNEVTQEIRRLREERWRFSYYFIAEATGVILLTADGKLASFLNLPVLCVLLLIQTACVVFYLYHMLMNHGYITDARNTRRRLERLFGLQSVVVDGEPLLPAVWKTSTVHRHFEFREVVIPLALFVVGTQVASIYVIASILWLMPKLAFVE